MSTYVISCGGTGGHLAPGISLAQGLIERGHRCWLVVSNKEVDSRLLKSYPELDYVRAPGAPFSLQPFKLIKFLLAQVRGFIFAVRFLNRANPDLIFGFGGFITSGIVVAGFLLHCPIVLHEANRMPGKAIRLFASLAQRVYLPQGVRLRSIVPKIIRHYGYPVRKGIKRMNRESARRALGIDVRGKLLLVFGGSQGAKSLNEWVKSNFEKLAEEGINVVCITGLKKGNQGLIEHTRANGEIAKAYFFPFCDNMAALLSAADLCVARAGAGSIAEFVRCQLPVVLVPYPYSADNHQQENARFHELQGGGVVVDENNLDRLYDEVLELIFNDWLLGNFQNNLENLNRSNALDLIINDVESIADEHHGRARLFKANAV